MEIKKVILVLLALLAIRFVEAKVELPTVFSDNMVLQQKSKVKVWGKSSQPGKITIHGTWNNKQYVTNVQKDGKWSVYIHTPPFGGPYDLIIADEDSTLTLKNILIGEVWLCSGQSNMEMPLAGWGNINNYKEEINNADFPDIRFLQVKQQTSPHPVPDAAVHNGGWVSVSPETIAEFSATAYFFARALYSRLGVPIGLIHSSWGGTIIEAWTSAEALKEISPESTSEYASDGPNRPAVLYNAMIHPFISFKIRGAIWYQGESNVERAHQYRTLFPALIQDWRDKWAQKDFPFYYVQLANFMEKEQQPVASSWAELRDAQMGTLRIANTGMAVIADIGDTGDIHPKNKQEVGKRLARIALNKTYKTRVAYSGPTLISYKIKGDEIHLRFDPKGKRLVSHADDSTSLSGFAIAGEDQVFHWANAVLNRNTVIVKINNVAKPVAVRYGWANNPDLSLYNEEGLPASPFKTDNWER